MNPWISIWTRPRATMRAILDDDPRQLVLLLACIAGFGNALDRASIRSMGDTMPAPMIIVIALVAGPIGGVIGLYLFGAIFSMVGRWFEGTAPPLLMRTAIAWSQVPVICAIVLWVPLLLIAGEEMFKSEMPSIEASPLRALALVGVGLCEIVVGVWAFVVMLKCIAEAHEFSAWRALGTVLISLLMFVFALVALIVPLVLVAGVAAG